MVINGKCHCGNISFDLTWEGETDDIPARACTCSFCVKDGGVWTSNPTLRLRIAVHDISHVSQYTFGTGTAEFHVCSRCGIVPFVTSLIEGRLYAVVNVNTFENVDETHFRRGIANVEGEEVASRRARRRWNWIADVQFAEIGT